MQINTISDYLDKISRLITFQHERNQDFKTYSVSGLNNLREALALMKDVGLFPHQTDALRNSSWFDNYVDQMSLSSEEHAQILRFINYYNNASDGIKHFANLIIPNDQELVLNIYLPNNYSFSDLESVSNDLKKCIELPALDVGGSANVISAQPGSIWLVVAFTTRAAISIVGKIIEIATRANIEIQKGKIFAQYAEGLKLDNEVKKSIMEAQKVFIDGIVEDKIDEAKENLDTENDITKVARLKLAVTKMSELLRKEIKFLPSPKLDLDIQNSFPKEETIDVVNEELKRLAAPKDDEPE